MKKIIFNILFVLLSVSSTSQSVTSVFYIDASNCGDKLKMIQDEVKSIISNDNSDKILLFISNGESPLIAHNIEDINKSLVRLRMISPPAVDPRYDLESLNREILNNDILSNLVNQSKSNGVRDNINFHFYFDASDYNSLNYKKNIIQLFLLSNNLEFNQEAWILSEKTTWPTSSGKYICASHNYK